MDGCWFWVWGVGLCRLPTSTGKVFLGVWCRVQGAHLAGAGPSAVERPPEQRGDPPGRGFGFRVGGSGFGVSSLGFGVWDLWFEFDVKVYCKVFGVEYLGFRG